MKLTKNSITYGFAFIGFSTLLCYVSNKSKKEKNMAEYTIIAKVVKVEKSDEGVSICIKGLGKYAYENKWSVLEGENAKSSTFFDDETSFKIDEKDNIVREILVAAMVNQKPLRLTIAGEESPYSITAVEMP